MIVFDIIDNGLGIAKNEQAQIFRPFGQANAGISKTFGGTGLGLSISRDLAREMGGDITVTSELGEGSTFSLSIPASASRSLRAA
jgi:signal transduction histidine kinase